MVRGLANGHFFPEYGELLFCGPVMPMPCGDMHQSVTDVLVSYFNYLLCCILLYCMMCYHIVVK